MSLTCKDLLNLKVFQEIKLVAGAEGLNRVVTYPYTSQTESLAQWVNGGELVFITGIAHKIELIPKLLEECVEKDLSGLVILTGSEYIHELPQELIDMANESKLPLFTMPWDLKLVDVSKEITNAISYEQIKIQKLNQLLNNIIFNYDNQSKTIFEQDAVINLKISNYNVIAILSCSKKSPDNDAHMAIVQHQIQELCDAHNIPAHSMVYGNQIVLLISTRTKKDLESCIDHLEQAYAELSNSCVNDDLLLSVGDIHKGATKIRDSYKEASSTMIILQRTGFRKCCCYNDLGLYRLLLQMKPDEMEHFYHKQLDALIKYEKQNYDDFLVTLKLFLENFNSMAKTAKALNIHRNTLIYRINKIKDILHCNLNDSTVCLELLLALIIKEYLDNAE